MASIHELNFKFEPEIQIDEQTDIVAVSNEQLEQDVQNNYCRSNIENQTLINYFTKCGEVLVKNGEFLINCLCDENFSNFYDFSKHYNDFHEIYDTSTKTDKYSNDLITYNMQQNHINGNLEKTFSEISINQQQTLSKTQYEEELFDDSDDVEVIEIGECKYTVKKILSSEDLTKLNNHQNVENIAQIDQINDKQQRILEFCPECNKLFPNLTDLKEHFANYHEKGRQFACEQCGKQFRLRESLREHIRSIHDRILPFKCQICDRGFFKSSALTIHIRGHTGERPFICEVCQKSFKTNGALNEHKFIHTGAKRYACQFCNKEFLHSSSLKKHERIHTGERPYNCEKCDSSFRTLDLLKEHMRLHGDEKPYKCRFCNDEFSHRIQLTEHNRIHNGVDPNMKKRRRSYKCEICDKVLSRKSNLRTHLRNTHRLLESRVEEIIKNLPTTTVLINAPGIDETTDNFQNEFDILQTIC